MGCAGPRPRKVLLGFTWAEIKLMSCIVAVLCLAINGRGNCSYRDRNRLHMYFQASRVRHNLT